MFKLNCVGCVSSQSSLFMSLVNPGEFWISIEVKTFLVFDNTDV